MKTLSLVIMCLFLSMAYGANDSCLPRAIAMIVEKLGMDVPVAGEFRSPDLPDNMLLYTVSDDSIMTQIGVRVFSTEVRAEIGTPICDCIERLLLELLLCEDIEAQKRVLKTKKIGLVIDGFPLGNNHFKSLDVAMKVMNETERMDFKAEDGDIAVTFTDESGNVLRITLPADVSVIFPFDKKEHEEYLYKKLTAYTECFSPWRTTVPSHFSEENGYMVSGNRYYMIDSISDKLYFKVKKGKVAIVCDSSDPVESLRNMAMGGISEEKIKGISLDVSFKSYNPDIGFFSVSLTHFLSFMASLGLEFYSGDLSSSGHNKALLVFYHPIYQYINMLSVEIPDGSAFPASCTLPSEFSAFIPQNNIMNLFKNK